ncbi:MAG: hypothetical protein E7658_05410 [Ruminococcaceae bacterium]|nr:hypothetical protein [Oscillospiraceae bacterium]
MDMINFEWNGFKRGDFYFEGRLGSIVFPNKEGWGNGRLCVMMEYFEPFTIIEEELLNVGFHLAHLQNANRCGTDADHAVKARFVDFIAEEFHLNPRFVGIGLSCGGLHTVNFASRFPDYMSLLYLDAPVLNLLSFPMAFGSRNPVGEDDDLFKEFSSAYGFTMSDFILYREHPMDRIPTLIENRLPVAMVYGDSDDVVPYHENGIVLEEAYRKTDIPFFCQGKAGCNHHPHCLEDNRELLEFIRQNML